jgi:hypothetical protein
MEPENEILARRLHAGDAMEWEAPQGSHVLTNVSSIHESILTTCTFQLILNLLVVMHKYYNLDSVT